MTTFGYAYHADSREILEGRRAFAKIKAIMCGLDGKAYETANDMVKAKYAPCQDNPLARLLISRSLAQPYNSPPFEAQLDAQRRAMGQSSGVLGGAFGGLL